MKISDIKKILSEVSSVNFKLENGIPVPDHFHVTEVGVITRHFIDCGGTVRTEKKANFQLWEAQDYDHRLKPQKLVNIISLSEKVLQMEDLEIEVEYQSNTIGRYKPVFDGENFILTSTHTKCPAKDNCGIPKEKLHKNLAEVALAGNACSPGGGCC